MAYDPSDLKLPDWLLHFLERLIAIRLPVSVGWRLGFTRPGVIFTAALIGVWAAALYSGNNLLYLCGAMISAITIVSIIQLVFLVRGLPNPIARMPLLEQNSVTVLREQMPLQRSVSAIIGISGSCGVTPLNLVGRCENHTFTLIGRIKPDQRGVFRCHHLQLSSSAPLGLFQLIQQRQEIDELVVMPEPVEWQLDSFTLMRSGADLTDGDEWEGLRAYAAGDALSKIHWRKATADSGNWKVKRFSSSAGQPDNALLRVDLRVKGGSTHAAFELLLGRVWFWVLQKGESGTLILGQQSFDLADSRQRLAAQRAIALAEPETVPASGDGGILLTVDHSD